MTAALHVDVLEAAIDALRAGLNVLPPREDGTKAPDTNEWASRQREPATESEVRAWYANGRTGLGVVCGAVSGGLELFEFDCIATWREFQLRAEDAGLSGLLARVEDGYLEETPGGVHLLYTCATPKSGKLAKRPKRPEEMRDPGDRTKTLVETKGEGGYCIVAPSYGSVHPTGRPYRLLSGGFDSILRLTDEERDTLHALARSFDEMPRERASESESRPRASDGELRPGDDFNARATWAEVLEPHGWGRVFGRGGETFWRRPGKAQGISATTNYADSGLLYVFSTSTPFESERGYDLFGAYALLDHAGDLAAAARDLAARGYGSVRSPAHSGAAPGDDRAASPTSDVANAQRLAQHFGGELRWTPGLGWVAWSGARWESSETGALARASRLGRIVHAEALRVGEQVAKADDGKERERLGKVEEALHKWARESEREPRVRAALNLARPDFETDAARFDAAPWLLNCENGTVDLTTGALRPHRRDDLLTKTTGIDYDANACSELWDRVLSRALPESPVRDYLQRVAGYTACGCGGEDVLVLIYGVTRTSKGTIQGAIDSALGEYGETGKLDLLAKRDKGDDPSRAQPGLARLRAARMVSIYETGRALRLDDALVKTLSGSDPLTVRELYRPEFTFRPQFVLWIATNHRPKVADDDDALWERLREIPFDVQIPEAERDRDVRNRLSDSKDCGPAVLRWIVEGALAYQREGLRPPDRVRAATAEYREAMDRLAPFLAACCVLHADAWTKSGELRATYEAWARETGEKPVGGREFGESLRRHGCADERRHAGRGWSGIGLLGSGSVTP